MSEITGSSEIRGWIPPEWTQNHQPVFYRSLYKCAVAFPAGGVLHSSPLGGVDDGDC